MPTSRSSLWRLMRSRKGISAIINPSVKMIGRYNARKATSRRPGGPGSVRNPTKVDKNAKARTINAIHLLPPACWMIHAVITPATVTNIHRAVSSSRCAPFALARRHPPMTKGIKTARNASNPPRKFRVASLTNANANSILSDRATAQLAGIFPAGDRTLAPMFPQRSRGCVMKALQLAYHPSAPLVTALFRAARIGGITDAG